MGKVATAVSWARGIAADNTHGYDQGSRWGPDYDCSSLIIQAYETAGVPVKTNGATYTGNMYNVFLATGFKDITAEINLATGAGLIAGDVLLHHQNHTELYIGDGRIVGAHINENGGVTGGATGDQTSSEISEGYYYNYPWDCVLRYPEAGGSTTVTKEDVTSANRYLTQTEMEKNAAYIWSYFSKRNWSMEAVAGMLGNMQTESSINPGIWESLDEGNLSGGFGLVQWTPASKYFTWCDTEGLVPSDIDAALYRIEYELAHGLQFYPTDIYPMTFAEFKTSKASPAHLAMVFLANYERPADPNQPQRGTQAEAWFAFLKTVDVNDQGTKTRGMPLLLMFMATRRRF